MAGASTAAGVAVMVAPGAVATPRSEDVTLIANFLPFELPYGGPNFNEFADDVRYEIKISNWGDARADIIYQFRFKTSIRNPNTFRYNTGPIASPTDENWNGRQTHTLTRLVRRGGRYSPDGRVLGNGLTCPPVNVGLRSPIGVATRRSRRLTAVTTAVIGGQVTAAPWPAT
jgi:hypothetical protein